MTTLSINEKIYKSSKSNPNQTLDEVFNYVLNDVISNEDVITSISIDGKALSQEEESKLAKELITNFKKIDFSIKNSTDLAFEALESCTNYLDLATEKIYDLSKCYSNNDIENANEAFGDVIEIMDLFIQLISKIHKKLQTKTSKKINTKEIQNLEIHLLSVLKALIPAKENNDIIMLCDLLEYELIDNLTQWKIKVLPEMKNIKID